MNVLVTQQLTTFACFLMFSQFALKHGYNFFVIFSVDKYKHTTRHIFSSLPRCLALQAQLRV